MNKPLNKKKKKKSVSIQDKIAKIKHLALDEALIRLDPKKSNTNLLDTKEIRDLTSIILDIEKSIKPDTDNQNNINILFQTLLDKYSNDTVINNSNSKLSKLSNLVPKELLLSKDRTDDK